MGPGENQRVDIEIVDAGSDKNVYLSKKGIKGESRFAVTAHSEGDIGVCLKNYLDASELQLVCGNRIRQLTTFFLLGVANSGKQYSRVIDLDVDIGADAVDYK